MPSLQANAPSSVERFVHVFAQLMVVWIILFGVTAYFMPKPFIPIGSYIRPLLGLIMFGMGMTLSLADFRRVAASPRAVIIGVAGQFIIMPLAGFAIAKGLNLPWELAVGTIMVGTCPSGTASNVMAYLARADVALSVTITAVNTLLAPVLTPLLLKLLAHQYVQVPAGAMFKEIMTVVVVPVIAGLAINHFAPRLARRVAVFAPVLSVMGIVLIVSFIIANNSGRIADFGWLLLASVALHNFAGYAGGYWLARWNRLPEAQCRAIACEVGIQNSALDISLAKTFYADFKSVPLPGALFSIWQNISGPVLAWWWSRRAVEVDEHHK